MRRSSIRVQLVALNVGLVLVAAAGVGLVAERLLARLAEEQALARVALAGASAREAVERARREMEEDARVLAERPTLARLLGEQDVGSLGDFLARFQKASAVTGCAVVTSAGLRSTSTPALPWDRIRASLPRTKAASLIGDEGEGVLVVGAISVPTVRGHVALAVRRLDAALLREIATEVGLDVTLVPRREALTAYGTKRGALLARAASEGLPATVRADDVEAFCRLEPLLLASGEVGAVLETRLPTREVDEPLSRLRRALAVIAIALCAVVILASVMAARGIAGPVAALTSSAERLGLGDLGTPIPVGGGAEVGTLAQVMEDTRLKLLHLTENLRQREAEAAAVLAGISEGVLTVDGARRIRYLNAQAAAIIGLPEAMAIGRFCGDALYPRLASDLRPCEASCPIVAARSRGSSHATEHLALPRGRRTTVVVAAPPSGDQQVVMIRDETEAESARRMRDAILANVSHEFRTPLAAQLASVEMLREQLEAGSAEEATTLVDSLERGALRLARLVDNLLESVRIEAGQSTIRQQDVALDEVIEEAVQQTMPLLRLRRQELDVELPGHLPTLRGDAPRLVQVIVNLVANANKYAPEGSTIKIGGRVTDDAVEVWVEDSGPGLPSGGSDLFRPFVRAPGAEPEQSGVGLGLWIVRSIVERHGGAVEGASTGKGARFTIRLPRGSVS